jgi:hypothetical protein
MSSAGTSNRSKDEIRNTQRREIVGTDMGTKDRYINVKNIFVLGWVEKVLILYILLLKTKERNECFYPL